MSDLTPDQTESVRRALADARVTDPIPTDVAARLDHVLDGLHAERNGTGKVVSLDARKRRRNASRMLVAAAAVVVGGFGIDAMLGHDLLAGQSANDSPGSAANREEVVPPATAPSKGSDLGEGSVASPTDGVKDGLNGLASGPVPTSGYAYALPGELSIQPDSLFDDARRVMASVETLQRMVTRCVTPGAGETAVLVSYEGRPAALLIQPPQGQDQVVELYSCPTGHTGRLLRRIVVPAR